MYIPPYDILPDEECGVLTTSFFDENIFQKYQDALRMLLKEGFRFYFEYDFLYDKFCATRLDENETVKRSVETIHESLNDQSIHEFKDWTLIAYKTSSITIVFKNELDLTMAKLILNDQNI